MAYNSECVYRHNKKLVLKFFKKCSALYAENYGMITLEFEAETNMDSALVKVNTALDTVKDSLPERCSSPSIMEISLDMLATMYVAVYDDNKDIYELTDFANDNVIPYFERQNGVASVSTVGLVDQMVEVRLNEEEIDALNNQLASHVSGKLDEAQGEINKAQSKITSGKADLEKGKKELEQKQTDTSNQLAEATKGLNTALASQQAYEANLNSLKASQAMTLYRRQGSRPPPWKSNAIKQNGWLRRPYK